MDELVERVRDALAAEYPGAPNGRVRDMPDRRAIRWYTTIGLVDKPLGMRGRTALYGPRHLQQLVAIKRRQSEGQSLAQIQIEFSWLTPTGLDEVARVPASLLHNDDDGPAVDDDAPRDRFWAHGVTTAPVAATSASSPTRASPAQASPAQASPAQASPAQASAVSGSAGGEPSAGWPGRRAARRSPSAVALDGGVILVVPHTVTDRDRDDIAAAAAPLIALLTDRGLTDGSSS